MALNSQYVRAQLREFRNDESGVGTVLSLFFAIMFLLIGGVALDGTNLWRNHQLMQNTADSAAHAAVVQLALGNSESQATQAALNSVQANMPTSAYGNLHADGFGNVNLVKYDPETNLVTSTGTPNAASVTLHRNDVSGNPVDTYVLRIADYLTIGDPTDLSHWDLSVTGVATVANTRRCNSTDGVYAQDAIRVSSSNSFGPGYCLHSQTEVWMPQQNSFAPTAGISMPDLEDCSNKCTNSANPGAGDAAFETNLLMPDMNAFILDTEAAFLSANGSNSTKDDFFFGKSLEISALAALEDAGVSTSGLGRGDVVYLTQAQFESATDIPSGLTYSVSCNANGNGGNTRLTIDASNGGDDLRDVAVVTNCSLEFGSQANVESSLLLSTRQSATATVTASSGAIVGTSNSCNSDKQSIIMALGNMHAPADFAGSNISVLVDGDIHLSASSSSSTIRHYGLSLHASGEIDIASNHDFGSCNQPPSGLMPGLRVIRFVVPS